MIHAIAIDDEKNALGIIREYCKKISDLKLLDTFTDPEKGMAYLAKTPEINLVFMDIQLAKDNGLSLTRQIPPHVKVIITTAYPEYAVEGYELDILDYLLKPFTLERFQRSLEKFRTFVRLRQTDSGQVTQGRMAPTSEDIIFVKSGYKVVKVRLDELKLLEGAGNYIALHTARGKVMTLQNMKAFEEYLMPYLFVRVHKSYIISIRHIDAIESNTVVIGDKVIPIGESYSEHFQKFLSENAMQF
jgi:DNA-binding LytR/AlgR family response regulator